MGTKRAAAKAEAAEMVDIAERLAPFLPPLVTNVVDEVDGGADQSVA